MADTDENTHPLDRLTPEERAAYYRAELDALNDELARRDACRAADRAAFEQWRDSGASWLWGKDEVRHTVNRQGQTFDEVHGA